MNAPPHGELLGAFRNQWRGRDVSIFAHPTDPTLVVTCGVPLTPEATDENTDVWTVEPRELYARWIGTFTQTFL